MRKHEQLVKRLALLFAAALLLGLAVLVCPANYFAHGFDSRVPDVAEVTSGGVLGEATLDETGYSLEFTPDDVHFAGFQLLLKQPSGNGGCLVLEIRDQQGRQITVLEEALQEIPPERWHKVVVKAKLEAGETYVLTLRAEDFREAPRMVLAEESLRARESREDALLIGYAYKQPTFTAPERVLLGLLLAALAGWLLLNLLPDSRFGKLGKQLCMAAVLVVLMSWNYAFGTLDSVNTDTFLYFQKDSEALAMAPIEAQAAGVEPSSGYGLGFYRDAKGIEQEEAANTDPWELGYHKTLPGTVLLRDSSYIEDVAVPGNFAVLPNGAVLKILETRTSGEYAIVTLDTEELLSREACGKLSDIRFRDREGNPCPVGRLSRYSQQYGLQGKIFRKLSVFLSVELLWLLCAMATAGVLVLVCWLVGIKYNLLTGAVWYVTFLLSPWVTNFARNLYWVEFTWFLPMVVGLICSICLEKRWVRLLSYAAAFGTVTVRCLCGYEYISVIMVGLIAFLLVDLAEAWLARDKKRALLLLRTVFLLGVSAVAGFLAALCLHARLGESESLLAGIRTIIEEVALRRASMTAGTINEYTDLTDSLLASAWSVVRMYFRFDTQIIVGLDGNLFPLLCLLPLGIFALEAGAGRPDRRGIAMYVVFLGATLSWHVLMKGHSYVHTHMNYVLWYFGFVQTCLYVILSRILNRNAKME